MNAFFLGFVLNAFNALFVLMKFFLYNEVFAFREPFALCFGGDGDESSLPPALLLLIDGGDGVLSSPSTTNSRLVLLLLLLPKFGRYAGPGIGCIMDASFRVGAEVSSANTTTLAMSERGNAIKLVEVFSTNTQFSASESYRNTEKEFKKSGHRINCLYLAFGYHCQSNRSE